MPTKSMLSIRPDYELATRYGAAWQTLILDVARMPVIDLYGPEATTSNFFSALATQDPSIVNIFGHGNYNIITCQNGELLLQGGVNTNVLSGRVVYDLSCRAGKDLADAAINEGCISFLGYDEDFIFVVTRGSHLDGGISNPMEDQAARGFFESHNYAPISYLRGATISASYYTSQNRFNYWIEVWNAIDSQVAGLLVWDRDHQVMKPKPIALATGIAPLIMAFVPLFLIPLTKHLKKTKPL